MNQTITLSRERRDLIEALGAHRSFLIRTAVGLTDAQARHRSTVSALSIGGIIKHVTDGEVSWTDFMTGNGLRGDDESIDWADPDPAVLADYQQHFIMTADETIAGILDRYAEVAAQTDRLVATIDDLDAEYPLPAAPWFTPGATRSARRTLIHIIAETAQHAGHADVIREAIDGQSSMG
ncbi:MAG TPA: DinB family protein [Acidimicrobiales bacterium]|nr:DinB family protein [Acidimicrobiales bacterium]